MFFGVQFFTKTGIFRIPGVVYYGNGLTADETAKFKEIFTEKVDLDKNVTIDGKYTFIKDVNTAIKLASYHRSKGLLLCDDCYKKIKNFGGELKS